MDLRLQASSYDPQTHVLSISIPCFIWEGAVVLICKLGIGHFRFQRGMPPCLKEIFTRYFVHFLHFLGTCGVFSQTFEPQLSGLDFQKSLVGLLFNVSCFFLSSEKG